MTSSSGGLAAAAAGVAGDSSIRCVGKKVVGGRLLRGGTRRDLGGCCGDHHPRKRRRGDWWDTGHPRKWYYHQRWEGSETGWGQLRAYVWRWCWGWRGSVSKYIGQASESVAMIITDCGQGRRWRWVE